MNVASSSTILVPRTLEGLHRTLETHPNLQEGGGYLVTTADCEAKLDMEVVASGLMTRCCEIHLCEAMILDMRAVGPQDVHGIVGKSRRWQWH